MGKTSLLIRHTSGDFPRGVGRALISHAFSFLTRLFLQFVPPVFDSYSAGCAREKTMLNVHYWDTHGQQAVDELWEWSFAQADVFLVCFSVVARSSLLGFVEKWRAELARNVARCRPTVQCVLVGTKTDLRDDAATLERLRLVQERPVSREEGMEYARLGGMAVYAETSSLTGAGVGAVFRACRTVSLLAEERPATEEAGKRKCVLQ